MNSEETVKVYLMEDLLSNTYKIGISNNPSRRSVEICDELLCAGSHNYFKVTHCKSCMDRGSARELEKITHEKFSDYHKNFEYRFGGYTECFNGDLPVSEVITFINKS